MKEKKESLLYRFIRPIISFLFPLIFRPKIIGKENIPSVGKIILAGNHTSNLDCLLLISSTKRCIHFLAKKELFSGIKKIIFSNMGLIPVDRSKKSHNSLVMAEDYLNSNMVIGIFPEGTTEKEKNKILPFKIGAVKMAYDTKSNIVPFIITGDYKPFSNNLTVRFLKSISINDSNLGIQLKRLENIISSNMRGD